MNYTEGKLLKGMLRRAAHTQGYESAAAARRRARLRMLTCKPSVGNESSQARQEMDFLLLSQGRRSSAMLILGVSLDRESSGERAYRTLVAEAIRLGRKAGRHSFNAVFGRDADLTTETVLPGARRAA